MCAIRTFGSDRLTGTVGALCTGEPRFIERTRDAHALTLIHGDFHVLGNVLFSPGNPSPKVIGVTMYRGSLWMMQVAALHTIGDASCELVSCRLVGAQAWPRAARRRLHAHLSAI